MKENIKHKLFNSFDLKTIKTNPDFKEDSVREVIILPILRELGYKQDSIVRSKKLIHPFLKTGTTRRPITLIPDYALKVENNFAWILDAKAPNQKIIDNDNVEQVYSYATHPEIRATYFALCNGIEFVLYRREQTDKPILNFQIDEIQYHWEQLKQFLSPNSFQVGKNFNYETTKTNFSKKDKFDYLTRQLLEEIPVKKQAAKRHFGVHGYFTKQSWNVVADYIKNYSKPGDIVLDPFSGSGVTPIEAMMNNRRAISIDLNPMAVFIVQSLIAPVNQNELKEAFLRIKEEYLKKEPKKKDEIEKALKKYRYPHGNKLPKSSDVKTVEQLFSKKQLAQLGLLKSIIKKEKNENIQKSLLLVFSSTVTKINKTYHNSSSRDINAGNAAAFAYYRYRLAKTKIELDVFNCYTNKFKKLLNAKKDIEYFINENTINNIKVVKGTATDLSWISKESVDYIYTDPPYGKKIPYLDLSVMWNAWLDLEVTKEDMELEAIEDGEMDKSKEDYNKLIAQSIKEMNCPQKNGH